MERKAAPRDAVEYCPMVAIVSTGDSLFPLGDSRPVYERLVAHHKRLIADVLSHRGRTSPPNPGGRTSVVLCLGTGVAVLCQDMGDTSVGSGGDTCGLRLSGELR